MVKLNLKIIFLAISASLLMITSCAKDVSETSEQVQRRILDSYLKVHNYQDIEPLDDGLYIIDSIGGLGAKVQDTCYIFVKYSIKLLTGVYQSTTYDSVAKLIGTYKIGNYYGDYVWAVGNSTLSEPMEKVLKTMRVGGKATCIVPPWLTSTTTSTSDYSVSYSSDGNILLYEVEVTGMTTDIDQYQIDLLEDFSNKYYNGMDSLSKGFYFRKTHDEHSADTLSDGVVFYVDYIGRLLDGSVFDTNIKDTAKRYHLYNSSSSYSGLNLTYYADSSKFADESDVVLGFAKAMTSDGMTYGDKCITFFDSNNGYGSSGSITNGKGVPGYTPMFFEIWIHKDEDD